MLTLAEARALWAFLLRFHQTQVVLTPVPVPLQWESEMIDPDLGVVRVTSAAMGSGVFDQDASFYPLSEEDDYPLPFEVRGFYGIHPEMRDELTLSEQQHRPTTWTAPDFLDGVYPDADYDSMFAFIEECKRERVSAGPAEMNETTEPF